VSRITAISPQFLVADLPTALEFYRDHLGFEQEIDYEGFYASVARDGCVIHLKCAPALPGERRHRQDNEHLDAYVEVDDAAALLAEFERRGVVPFRPLERRPWGARDFYVLDPDGHVLCFSEAAG